MRRLVRRFLADRSGVAALEFVLIAPIVLILLLGSVTVFVMVREDQTAKMSTYTAADMVSRQAKVNDSYLNFVYTLFLNVAKRTSSEAAIRVTSVTKSGNNIKVDWSFAKAPLNKMTTPMIPHARLPMFGDGESLVITETTMQYSPLSKFIGWNDGERYNISVSRPRFAKAIAKE